MAIGINVTSIGSNLIDSAVDYLGVPVNNASPIYQSRNSTDLFKVSVNSSIHGFFSCQVPSNVRLSLSSKFSNLLDGKLGLISTINKGLQATSALTGSMVSLNTKYTTAMYWEGSSPVSLTIPIELNARTDVDREILIPMRILSSMALPRERPGSTLLAAPGPSPIDLTDKKVKKNISKIQKTLKSYHTKKEGLLASAQNTLVSWGETAIGQLVKNSKDGESNEDRITIKVGKVLLFKRCIVTKVDWDIDMTRLLVSTGKPMKVKGDLTFMTSSIMTDKGLKDMLAPVSEQNSLMSEATNKLDEWVTDKVDTALDNISSLNIFGTEDNK